MDCGGLDTRWWNLSLGILAVSVVGCGPTITLIGDTESDTESGPGDGGVGDDTPAVADGIELTGDVPECTVDQECPPGLVCLDNRCTYEVVDGPYDDGPYDGDDYYDDDFDGDHYYCYEYGPNGECCDYEPCPEYCDEPEDCNEYQQCLESGYVKATCVNIPLLPECAFGPSFVPLPITVDPLAGEIERLDFVDADPTAAGAELVVGHELGAPTLVYSATPETGVALPIPNAGANVGAGGAVGGDFTGDSLADIAVVDGMGDVHVLAGDGAGGFTFHSSLVADMSTAWGEVSLVALDFDGDGARDIVGTGLDDQPTLLHNDGTGQFDSTHVFFTPPPGAANFTAGQFDGVGPLDIMVSTAGTTAVYVGVAEPPAEIFPEDGGILPPSVFGGQFHLDAWNDGTDPVDILVGGFRRPAATLVQNARNGVAGAAVVPLAGSIAGLADVHGDGNSDLVLVGDDLLWVTGIPPGLGGVAFDCYGVAPNDLDNPLLRTVGDFDGNGLEDLAISDETEVVVYLAF